jgi:UDP-glucuronate decarboxylase
MRNAGHADPFPDVTEPVNLGNPNECTISHLAHMIRAMVGSTSEFVHERLPTDDPVRRKPEPSSIFVTD